MNTLQEQEKADKFLEMITKNKRCRISLISNVDFIFKPQAIITFPYWGVEGTINDGSHQIFKCAEIEILEVF